MKQWIHDWYITLRYGTRLTKAGRELRRSMQANLDEYVEVGPPAYGVTEESLDPVRRLLEEVQENPKWADLWGMDPNFTPKKTPVPRFEAGHGRPDLDMLHQVVDAIDRGEDGFRVREMVAQYIRRRPDDRKDA